TPGGDPLGDGVEEPPAGTRDHLQGRRQVPAGELRQELFPGPTVHVDPDELGYRPQRNPDVRQGVLVPPAADVVGTGPGGLVLLPGDGRGLAGGLALLRMLLADAVMAGVAAGDGRPPAGQVPERGREALGAGGVFGGFPAVVGGHHASSSRSLSAMSYS